MTFINASGTKKFKPAWQPVEAKPADVEEKENSSRYELESNGQQNLNSQSEEKKAQLPADEGYEVDLSFLFEKSLHANFKYEFVSEFAWQSCLLGRAVCV